MNNNILFNNSIRFVFFWMIQVLVLDEINLSNYTHLYIYPIFILLLPFKTPVPLTLILSFALGLSVDIYANSPGLHAFASVLTAYIRPTIAKWLEPRKGYDTNQIPTMYHLGSTWFMQYAGVLMFIHIFTYCAVEAFTPYYFLSIMGKTIGSFTISMLLVMLHQFIFTPKN